MKQYHCRTCEGHPLIGDGSMKALRAHQKEVHGYSGHGRFTYKDSEGNTKRTYKPRAQSGSQQTKPLSAYEKISAAKQVIRTSIKDLEIERAEVCARLKDIDNLIDQWRAFTEANRV